MFSSPVLALSLPLLGSSSATLDVGASAEISASTGQTAASANEPSEFRTGATLEFRTGVQRRTAASIWTTTYGSLFYQEYPTPIELARPLVLHRLGTNLGARLSPRTALSVGATASAGEVSYGQVDQLYDPGTVGVLSRFLPIFDVTGTASLARATSPRNSIVWDVGGGYRRTLRPVVIFEGTTAERTAAPVPENYDVGGGVTDTYEATRVDSLSLGIHGRYVSSQDEEAIGIPSSESVLVEATGSWARRLSATRQLTLTVGNGVVVEPSTNEVEILPSGSVRYTTAWQIDRQAWASTWEGGTRIQQDPILASFRPLAFASWSLSGRVGRDLDLQTRVFGATSLGAPVVPAQYETELTASQGAAYRLSESWTLNGSIGAQLRAPHLEAEDPQDTQPEWFTSLGLRYNVGTGTENGSWL